MSKVTRRATRMRYRERSVLCIDVGGATSGQRARLGARGDLIAAALSAFEALTVR